MEIAARQTFTASWRFTARSAHAVRHLAVFARVEHAVGAERAEAVTLLLIAIADRLSPARRDELSSLVADGAPDALGAEIASLRDQIGALWRIVAEAPGPRSG